MRCSAASLPWQAAGRHNTVVTRHRRRHATAASSDFFCVPFGGAPAGASADSADAQRERRHVPDEHRAARWQHVHVVDRGVGLGRRRRPPRAVWKRLQFQPSAARSASPASPPPLPPPPSPPLMPPPPSPPPHCHLQKAHRLRHHRQARRHAASAVAAAVAAAALRDTTTATATLAATLA